jgi:hypothetical protein
MRRLTTWLVIAGASAVSVEAAAQGPLAQLRLDTPPSQTLFCSVGEQVQLRLTGTDSKLTPTSLEPYKIRIRSSNPQVVDAQGRGPDWAVADVACRADGDAWILADGNGARAWMRVLVGSARAAPAVATAPPESVWGEGPAIATVPTGATASLPTASVRTRTLLPRGVTLQPVAAVTLSGLPGMLEQGVAQPIVATLRDAAGSVLAGRTVSWQSSNPAMASVDANGLVTAVEVGGPVTITATSEAASATATTTVKGITPYAAGATFSSPTNLGTLSPGQTVMRVDYFTSTGDQDRWYQVTVRWPQPAGCTSGTSIGPTFSLTLTGVPAGRQYDLSLKKSYYDVVQESKQPGNHDQNISVNGTCGTGTVTFYVQVHRTSGLPSSTPFRLTFVQGT